MSKTLSPIPPVPSPHQHGVITSEDFSIHNVCAESNAVRGSEINQIKLVNMSRVRGAVM